MKVETKKDNLPIPKKIVQKKMSFIWKNVLFTLIPLIIGLIVSMTTVVVNFESFFKSKKENHQNIEQNLTNSEENLKIRYNASDFEKLLQNIEKINKFDSLEIAKEVAILKSDYSRLSNNLNSLNLLLQDDPTKFLEIAMIKKDIDDIKKQVENNNKNIQREVDRISSYNNTLIVFMITFLVAYIGIGVFNIIDKAKKNASNGE